MTLALGGRRAVMEALRSARAKRVLCVRGSRSTEGLRQVLLEAERAGVPVEWVDRERVESLEVRDAQGVVAIVRPPRELDEGGLARVSSDPAALLVILDGITDPQNLGACARCAEAAGAIAIVARRRRAAPVSAAAIRASAGALLHLPLARVPNLSRTIHALKERGFSVVGLDHRAPVDVHAAVATRPLALVVGSEDSGISRLVRESCDELVSIPMPGRTASLNASAALAVGLFAYALRPNGRVGAAATMPEKAGVAQPGSASDL